MRSQAVWSFLLVLELVVIAFSCGKVADPRLAGARRGEGRNGWIPVRLQGSPAQIGFQHGYLLAPEITDALEVQKLLLPHDTKRDWAFLRAAAEKVLWPRIEEEYRR